MAGFADAAVETSKSIGRYFSVISMVPSLLFVLYVYALVAAGAWSGPFEPAKALHAAEDLGIRGIIGLAVAALLLGLVLHPFQFSMTQFLEGYWGNSWMGRRLAYQRIMYYRNVAWHLNNTSKTARETWHKAAEAERLKRQGEAVPEEESERWIKNWLNSRGGNPLLADYLRAEAAGAEYRQYPEEARRIMPTRLGNALRRDEDLAGERYGLNVLSIAPHLNLVAVKEHREYVEDCRQGLDLGVRICALFALATALSIGLLINNGAWLLLALAPYCVSYLAYRGAISSAQSYGTALSTLVDLNRFALYDQLHLPHPPDTFAEYDRNVRLGKLLSGEKLYLGYAPPKDADGAT